MTRVWRRRACCRRARPSGLAAGVGADLAEGLQTLNLALSEGGGRAQAHSCMAKACMISGTRHKP